ncbi:MAG: hypothetical protein QXG39_00240 [Candidatus Aenigmatarchaeota archaeon]
MPEEFDRVRDLIESIKADLSEEYKQRLENLKNHRTNFFNYHSLIDEINKEIDSFNMSIENLLIDIDEKYPDLKKMLKTLKSKLPTDKVVKDLETYDELLHKTVRALTIALIVTSFYKVGILKAESLISKVSMIELREDFEKEVIQRLSTLEENLNNFQKQLEVLLRKKEEEKEKVKKEIKEKEEEEKEEEEEEKEEILDEVVEVV